MVCVYAACVCDCSDIQLGRLYMFSIGHQQTPSPTLFMYSASLNRESANMTGQY